MVFANHPHSCSRVPASRDTMPPPRMHAPGAEGAPLLATERDAASRGVDARADRAPPSRATRLALAATATLLVGAGAIAVSSDAARAVAAGGIARAFALGDPADAPDPLEADGTRPMSAYGKIAADSPLMDPSRPDDPNFDPTTVVEPDAVPGADEGIPEVEVIDDDVDADEAAVGLAASAFLSQTTPSLSLSATDAQAVQDDVDDQIEREMVNLRRAAARVQGVETADMGKQHETREKAKRPKASSHKKTSRKASEPEPEVSEPEVSEPEASEPEVSEPEVSEAEVSEPEVSEPEASSADEAAIASAASNARERLNSASSVKTQYAANVDAALRGSRPVAAAATTTTTTTTTPGVRNALKREDASGAFVAAAGAAVPDPSASSSSSASASVATTGEALPMTGDGTDGSWWRMVEGQARSGRGEPPAWVPDPNRPPGTCDWNVCDKNAGPQYVDQICVDDGGIGCRGNTGCRFCRMEGDDKNPEWQYCPPCVCDEFQTPGCKSPGSTGSSPAALAARERAAAEQHPEMVAVAKRATNDLHDANAPVVLADAAAAIGEDEIPEGAIVVNGEVAVVPATPAPAPERLNGVAWTLTGFGKFESCNARCERAQMRCSDDHWPDTFAEFVEVVAHTTPEDGRDGVCTQIVQQDVSRHCAHSVVALSGRCFFQSMHRPISCDSEEDYHSDCQNFCPCV